MVSLLAAVTGVFTGARTRETQKVTNEAGNNSIFLPIVLSASVLTVAFLKDVYARAKAGCEALENNSGVVDLGHTPENGVHGDKNLPIVVRPHHDPNRAPHTAPRSPVAGAPNRRA